MTGRLAAVGLGLMALVCTAVIIGALLGFTWLVDRASEMFEYKAAHPSSSSQGAGPPGVSSLTLPSTPAPPGQLASSG